MDSDELAIRPAERRDVSAVLSVWASARSAAADVEDTEHDLRLLLDHDPGALLVAEADGAIVGTAVATWDGWRGGIHRLVVVPGRRRRGVGRALIQATHARLRALGAKRVNILLAEIDPGAAELWRDAGYRTDPRVARWFYDL